MERKRYEVKGMMEWHPVFSAGRTRLRVSFTGGHLCGGAATPACFETSDPVVQKVIESSAAYRSGRIRCVKVSQTPSERRSESSAMRLTAMEFDNRQQAADFLQDNRGIPLDRLLTWEKCRTEAFRLGIDLRIKEKGQP